MEEDTRIPGLCCQLAMAEFAVQEKFAVFVEQDQVVGPELS